MGISLLLLWSIPLAIGLVMAARVADGGPPVRENERQLLFGDGEEDREITLLPWMAVKFALFAVFFFIIGVLQGLVFANLGTFWTVIVPLLTGAGAMLLAAYWIRSGARENRRHRQRAHSHRSHSRIASLFSR